MVKKQTKQELTWDNPKVQEALRNKELGRQEGSLAKEKEIIEIIKNFRWRDYRYDMDNLIKEIKGAK